MNRRNGNNFLRHFNFTSPLQDTFSWQFIFVIDPFPHWPLVGVLYLQVSQIVFAKLSKFVSIVNSE